jgi:lipoprotein-anchoring transpeptidase ErfK/SrfK
VPLLLDALLVAFLVQGGSPPAPAAASRETALAIQVALDRAGFSPGTIDGAPGPNTTRAAQAYRERHGTDPAPHPAPTIAYRITEDDATYGFAAQIPEDLVEQSTLPALAYTSLLELLAERYHTTPHLLKRLNRGAAFAAGEEIQVPNVEPFAPPTEGSTRETIAATGTSGRGAPVSAGAKVPAAEDTAAKPEVSVTVSESQGILTVRDASGQVVFHAPVTTGSENDPLPIGEWKVNGVKYNPPFNYNPDLFWDADPSHAEATLAPGPNNPVGVVWIDLSREHYGIHGTPEPAAVGRTSSHGCVRMTNWDALALARLVGPGTPVVFTR